MSTLNGIGTFHYGNDPRPDGSYIATRYLVVFFLPILPLGSERMRKLTVDKNVGLLGAGETRVEILEQLPIQWSQVWRAYLRCWLLMPLLLLWPMLVLVAIAGIVHAIAGKATTSAFMSQVTPIFAVIFAIYFIGMATYLLRRTRRVGLDRS